MIRVEGVTFRHAQMAAVVLRGVSFAVAPGRLVALLGPNGSGKTTLLRCLAGLWPPTAGRIFIDGREMGHLSHRQRAALLAVVPQEHAPAFPYTVRDAVLMGRAPHIQIYAGPAPADLEATRRAMEVVGISHLASRPTSRLSGGERQLTLIARTLAQEAPLLLLDEPTSHLDFRNQHRVLELVRRIAAEKALTVVMTLHDPNLAAVFAHQVILLKDGAILAIGAPETVLTEDWLCRLYDMPIGVLTHADHRLMFARRP
jgi:iron complex transport system ATP-binding protein